MKRKILVTAIITATLFILMAVSASACRLLPCYASDAVDSGSISLGKTEITTSGDECRKYTFTPDKDGFYALDYSDFDCSFLETEEDEDGEYYGFYYYISCYGGDDETFITTEFVEMSKGEEYTLYVINPSAYDEYEEYYEDEESEVVGEMTSTVEIRYAGELVDFDIYEKNIRLSEVTCYDYETDSLYEGISSDQTEYFDDGCYLYTYFIAEFSELGTFESCSLNENSCCIVPLKIVEGTVFNEGENEIRVDLLGHQKDFTVYSKFTPDGFITYGYSGYLSNFISNVECLCVNINTGIRIMVGLEGIGSPKPVLGAQVIRLAFSNFFESVTCVEY